MEDYKVNKRDLNYKRRGRPKMDFWSPNKGYGKKRRRKKKKRKKGEIKTLVWIIVVNCMIFVHKLLGYRLIGFYLEIYLVPFFRVLLGVHPNSRFKGSLVENP